MIGRCAKKTEAAVGLTEMDNNFEGEIIPWLEKETCRPMRNKEGDGASTLRTI